ncbi:hypothetical protein ACFO3I_03305 [Rheinheimera marina]|uniref:Uncharacterized protein n=1 Tax=Rheinheimera marina TaxID=1774958 RepID=A0ABV9JJL3_9GAMM
MQSLIPVPAYFGKGNNEIVLLDPSRLAEWQGLDNEQPKILCKTMIYGNYSTGWSLYLHEHGNYHWLMGADVAEPSEQAPLDLIALFGHYLAIMPGQKLIFCSVDVACFAVSFISASGCSDHSGV